MGNFKFLHEGKYPWYTPTVEVRVIHDFTTSIEVAFGDEIERVRQICAGRTIGQMLHFLRMMCEKENSVLSSEGWNAVLVVAGLLINLPGYGTSSIVHPVKDVRGQ